MLSDLAIRMPLLDFGQTHVLDSTLLFVIDSAFVIRILPFGDAGCSCGPLLATRRPRAYINRSR
jgi:hypothetical protein